MRLRFGPFALDQEARRLLRDGAPVELTPRAFDLLSILVVERPRVLGREVLERTLWPGTWVGSTSLAQLVTEIRKGLGDRARAPVYVRTVFRRGYAFCGEASEEHRLTPASRGPSSRFQVTLAGRTIPLDEGENLIGRAPEARVLLSNSLASRHHARIVVAGPQAVLEDLGSRNGTHLWDRSVSQAIPLVSGDVIIVGDEALIFAQAHGAAPDDTDPGSGDNGSGGADG